MKTNICKKLDVSPFMNLRWKDHLENLHNDGKIETYLFDYIMSRKLHTSEMGYFLSPLNDIAWQHNHTIEWIKNPFLYFYYMQTKRDLTFLEGQHPSLFLLARYDLFNLFLFLDNTVQSWILTTNNNWVREYVENEAADPTLKERLDTLIDEYNNASNLIHSTIFNELPQCYNDSKRKFTTRSRFRYNTQAKYKSIFENEPETLNTVHTNVIEYFTHYYNFDTGLTILYNDAYDAKYGKYWKETRKQQKNITYDH